MTTTTFQTDDGVTLEGELRDPEGEARGTAVICHPHPAHGGSKDHPLLWAIRNELARRGWVVLAFNFRGVMGSGGEHSGGEEETRDLRAAIDRVREEAEGPTVVVGWSFGANVAVRHSITDERVAAVALVGLPIGFDLLPVIELPDNEDLRAWETPVLLVAGDDDAICPVPGMLELSGRIPNADVEVIEGGGHFFRRMEREPATAIAEFFDEVLQ
ncbi:MAG TPA: alpha/beta fold hydrolase [Actinomycetota bacterium]